MTNFNRSYVSAVADALENVGAKREDASYILLHLANSDGGDHIVMVSRDDYTIQHPIAEKLTGDLFDCPLAKFMSGLTGPPVEKAGTYIVRSLEGNGWLWVPEEALRGEEF